MILTHFCSANLSKKGLESPQGWFSNGSGIVGLVASLKSIQAVERQAHHGTSGNMRMSTLKTRDLNLETQISWNCMKLHKHAIFLCFLYSTHTNA